jgi:hypothetical protein
MCFFLLFLAEILFFHTTSNNKIEKDISMEFIIYDSFFLYNLWFTENVLVFNRTINWV